MVSLSLAASSRCAQDFSSPLPTALLNSNFFPLFSFHPPIFFPLKSSVPRTLRSPKSSPTSTPRASSSATAARSTTLTCTTCGTPRPRFPFIPTREFGILFPSPLFFCFFPSPHFFLLNFVLYIFFRGSLTTPPCAEVVTWHVIEQPLTLSKAQVHTDMIERFFSFDFPPSLNIFSHSHLFFPPLPTLIAAHIPSAVRRCFAPDCPQLPSHPSPQRSHCSSPLLKERDREKNCCCCYEFVFVCVFWI